MNSHGDRISSLPDDLIARILSFIGTKQAVETSVLSSRWRFIWTKIPYLNISNEGFSTTRKFHKFFTNVLSSCNNQVEMSLNLHGKISQVSIQRILNHACSHNLQQLTFTFLCEYHIQVPLSLFSSRTLKHLTLIGTREHDLITPTSMWELPALTTLHLDHITLHDDVMDKCVGLFSKCTNMKTLTINSCQIVGLNTFTISHPQLSNLKLISRWSGNVVVHVVAPQLKNLTIINCVGEHMISAPELTSLIYKNRYFKLSMAVDSLPTLEKVDLCISHPHDAVDAQRVVDLLQKFNHVKFLTLSLEIIEILSSYVEAITLQPSPFVSLTSLKIHPELFDETHKMKVMSTEVKKYLLNKSPGATFTIVSREEARAMRDATYAQKLMKELRVLLDQEKALIEEYQEDNRSEPCTNMLIDMCKEVSQIRSYWKDLNELINQGKEKTISIITLIEHIKDLLIKLPTSKKAELQPCFSSLCAEADTVMNKIVNRMRIECDSKGSSLTICLHELATAAQSSS